ncbi:cyclase family protein [Planctomicrobium piriforme]|uniref:cyclase family protein n=1 Tax=Planctomicrobium piriforme TaxID=1576369 RepID=UPI001FEA0713|nr:cyclase family protein [Planctomicrobium piriforme]
MSWILCTVDLLLADETSVVPQRLDLSYALNPQSNFWPGPGYSPFQLETIATLEKNGVLSKKVSFPEHIGTHLDAPNHFEQGQPDVSQIPVEQLFAPGVLIDFTARAESNPDAELSTADIADWEAAHGRIPDGAVVLLHTGWGRFWTQPERFLGRDVRGQLHFPGYSAEAAKFLVEQRQVKGLGIDTLSVDPGTSKSFDVHHILNLAQRYGLENVAHLDQLPPRGFDLIIAPLKVEGGTGGPCRIFATLKSTADAAGK